MNALDNTNIILQNNKDENKKIYQVKNFLLAKSWLVKFDKKEEAGESLSKQEQAKQARIYELRDKTFNKIIDEIAKYYEMAIDGNYRFDGMPYIDRGVRGQIENKIWRLLIEIGEPGNIRYKDADDNFWVEA